MPCDKNIKNKNIKNNKNKDIEKENLKNVTDSIKALDVSLEFIDNLSKCAGVDLPEEINSQYHLLVKTYKLNCLKLVQLLNPTINILLYLIKNPKQNDYEDLFFEFSFKLISDPKIKEATEILKVSVENIKQHAANISDILVNNVSYDIQYQIITKILYNISNVYKTPKEWIIPLEHLNDIIDLIIKAF